MSERRPVLVADGLVKRFALREGLRAHRLQALREVNLEVYAGECLALVGESGCGKTTLGKCLVGHLTPDEGCVMHEGTDLSSLRGAAWRRRRRRLQLVFQDSSQAFDPRLTIFESLAEALPRPKRMREQAADLLAAVELDETMLDRLPHQLSGGQRQRLGILRALAAEADVVVLDEPVSALDVSLRDQILDLLSSLRQSHDLALVFIGHDLGAVRKVADRVAVLYSGRIVEIGSAEEVLSHPSHPYTAALLEAVPRLGPRAESPRPLAGDVPSAIAPPPGCAFHPRCPKAEERCRIELPMLRSPDSLPQPSTRSSANQRVACHFPKRPA
ncbi:MAG: ABC transporter ATP-binding protein [Thermoanaerobaculia bacterium]|nr:ABC transporter ATP-binding protein [Thermoanaerobaculia bacterium]